MKIIKNFGITLIALMVCLVLLGSCKDSQTTTSPDKPTAKDTISPSVFYTQFVDLEDVSSVKFLEKDMNTGVSIARGKFFTAPMFDIQIGNYIFGYTDFSSLGYSIAKYDKTTNQVIALQTAPIKSFLLVEAVDENNLVVMLEDTTGGNSSYGVKLWNTVSGNLTPVCNDLYYESIPVVNSAKTKVAYVNQSSAESTSGYGNLVTAGLNSLGYTVLDSNVEVNHDFYGSISWSKTRNEIVYVKNHDFYLIDCDTKSSVRLTYDGTDKQSPVFSPDGQYIAYCEQIGTTHQISLIKRDGTGKKFLIDQPSSYKNFQGCVWKADSKYLLTYSLMSENSGDGNLYLINVTTGESKLVDIRVLGYTFKN